MKKVFKLEKFTYFTVFENLEKVSFNIASEASYVYIVSLQSNSITRHVTQNKARNGGKCQNWKIKCDILCNFQTMWESGRIFLK